MALKKRNIGRLAEKLAVPAEPGLTNAQLMLTNHDLKPVEPERRQWGPWNFVAFWVADSFNINTWMISSSMIVAGLSWWQSWLCVWIGYTIAGCFICLTGRIGATYHIGFPVVARSSFGIWGSLWPVFNRAAMACIWYGVQSYIGGHCVYLMIRSIWLSWDRHKIPNTFPESSGTTTADFVSFFLFWAGSLPAIWFPVHKIRHLFTVKSYFVPCAGIAFLIWAVVRAGGVGPIVRQPAKLHGSELAWEFVKGVMSSIANFATLIVNDPDFSRFAQKPRDALWSQLFTIPIGFAVTSFIGIIVSSSSAIIYNTDPIWDPLDLLEHFIDDGGSAQRFGVFVIALAFTLAQLGTNIAANSVSAGTDMTALLPRYINIRRGGYICAAVGLAMCPWTLLTSSNQFTTYLSAYSVFLSSIAGVIISDYYFVRRGYLEVKELYDARKAGPYFFGIGIHWRAYVAYIAGIVINVVGFAGAIGREVPIGATYIYNVNFFAGFIVSSGCYWLLCKFFPVPATSDRWMEVGDEVDDIRVAYNEQSGSQEFDDEQPEYKGSDTKMA
ncbi:uracil permease [Echria macrotheca]|uniref:Uracil permease n=1 Tax=Echria macrotheca TaxID=438768 RepID=A0AAJ0F6P8_9PEZI|nr:uracil permease [Echria macrotheca]